MVGMLLYESSTYLKYLFCLIFLFIKYHLFHSHGIIVICHMIYHGFFYFYTEEMTPIYDEIEVKDEPWLNSSDYDQVSYGVQVSRFLFHISIMMLSQFHYFSLSYLYVQHQ